MKFNRRLTFDDDDDDGIGKLNHKKNSMIKYKLAITTDNTTFSPSHKIQSSCRST